MANDIEESSSTACIRKGNTNYPDTKYLIKRTDFNRLFKDLNCLPRRNEALFQLFLDNAFQSNDETYSFLEWKVGGRLYRIPSAIMGQAFIDLFDVVGNPDDLHVDGHGICEYILSLLEVSIRLKHGQTSEASYSYICLINDTLMRMQRVGKWRCPKNCFQVGRLKARERVSIVQALPIALIGLGFDKEMKAIISYLKFQKAKNAKTFTEASINHMDGLRYEAQRDLLSAWGHIQISGFAFPKFFYLGKYKSSTVLFGRNLNYSTAPYETKHIDLKEGLEHTNGGGELKETLQMHRNYRWRLNLGEIPTTARVKFDDDIRRAFDEEEGELFSSSSSKIRFLKGHVERITLSLDNEIYTTFNDFFSSTRVPTFIYRFKSFSFYNADSKQVYVARAWHDYHGKSFFSDVALQDGSYAHIEMIFTAFDVQLALVSKYYQVNICRETGFLVLEREDQNTIVKVEDVKEVVFIALPYSRSSYRLNPFIDCSSDPKTQTGTSRV
jgi:hypothetical protein